MQIFEDQNWNDWRWQIRNSVRTSVDLENYLELETKEREALCLIGNVGSDKSNQIELPFSVTPYYLSLLDLNNPKDPLRQQLIPRTQEFEAESFALKDPMGDLKHEAVPYLVHRYPDRALLLVTDRCAAYCRFCTRKRWVGRGPTPKISELEKALEYVEERSEIKDLILTGGDALILNNNKLRKLLERIRKIKHIEIIRIATRMLTFAPMRFDDELIQILQDNNPVYIMSHINHVNELSDFCVKKLEKLANNGLGVMNQAVLLKNINDSTEELEKLFRKLSKHRARPYYLHQSDLAKGTKHFRVPFDRAVEIMGELNGKLSGLCTPKLMLDLPNGNGKVPIYPDPIVARHDETIELRGFNGQVSSYPLE